jgi:hypothetical protein
MMWITADPGNTIYRAQIHIFLGTARTVTAAAAVPTTAPSISKNVPDRMGAGLRIIILLVMLYAINSKNSLIIVCCLILEN